MLLLGGITSLPEIATVTTASWTGNAPLADNNLLGSASINIVLLAAADAAHLHRGQVLDAPSGHSWHATTDGRRFGRDGRRRPLFSASARARLARHVRWHAALQLDPEPLAQDHDDRQ
jgi:hypothetical protein